MQSAVLVVLLCSTSLCLLCFSYYDLEAVSDESVNKFLSKIVEKIINDLSESYCLVVDEVCLC